MKLGAHRYFVADPGKKLSKEAALLFRRIFSSEFDFTDLDKSPKVVYPLNPVDIGNIFAMGMTQTSNDHA